MLLEQICPEHRCIWVDPELEGKMQSLAKVTGKNKPFSLKQAGSVLLLLTWILLLSGAGYAGQNVRPPVWEGKFYPDHPAELQKSIREFIPEQEKIKQDIPQNKSLRALILPHAGYPYSGPTAAHSCPVLDNHTFSKVVIMGPDHRVGFKNASISDTEYYKTPLGKVKLHHLSRQLLQKHSLYNYIAASDRKEHSVEVILPFLQHTLQDFSIIPIVTASGEPDDYIRTLDPVLDQSTLLIASSDLSHYLPYSRAQKRDRNTLEMIKNLDTEKIKNSKNRACGKLPISVILEMAKDKDWEPVVLDYSNSGDTAGPKDKVVGYSAVAFFQNSSTEKAADNKNTSFLTREQGKALLRLARRSIQKELDSVEVEPLPERLQKVLQSRKLQKNRGTFVTLNQDSSLRGCMGNISAGNSILEGIEQNAVKAAFRDPRFPELSAAELPKTRIKISILSKPKPLDYNSPKQLLQRLQKEKPGVILQKGYSRATYLPQVWEKLPDPQTFLTRLCQKAGLSKQAWKEEDIGILTYRAQYFEE